MITSPAFAAKRYCILGLARSGLATLDALMASGAQCTVWDNRDEARETAVAAHPHVVIGDPMEIDLDGQVLNGEVGKTARLFAETPGRLLVEVASGDLQPLLATFEGKAAAVIGRTTNDHDHLRISLNGDLVIDEALSELKEIWKNGLTPYY